MTTPDNTADPAIRQHIYDVSELNQNIKTLLEDSFPFVWISGEISNFKIPSSGHCYLTLKDQHSQIQAVMFRGQARGLKFRPEDGLSIIGFGRLSVYTPRGLYQLILEYMEPKGLGSLHVAFDKLKRRLAAEGLFDDQRKKPLPVLSRQVSIVTSPTGAAIRDFINVAHRRFPNLPIEVVGVHVQGDLAPAQIVRAIAWLNARGRSDVIVLARGGGSIEDLWAFNDETVARAIAASDIPIVSAVGHETDFTIADFVADLRAPTPSAAAEIVVPSKNELQQHLAKANLRLYKTINLKLKILYNSHNGLVKRMIHPRRRLQDMRIRLDDIANRLVTDVRQVLARRSEHIAACAQALRHVSPARTVAVHRDRVAGRQRDLHAGIRRSVREGRSTVATRVAMLEALNPLAILKRGYSITRTISGRTIVRDANTVKRAQALEVLLGSGRLIVTVERAQPADPTTAMTENG
jgi:exodeoxyribonuclease VII large subunit